MSCPGFVILLLAISLHWTKALPADPIFFQKPIMDPRIFRDFLLSNANIGRAETTVCVFITAAGTPPPPRTTKGRYYSSSATDSSTVATPEPSIPDNPPTVSVRENVFWVVGSCSSNFSVEQMIKEVTNAKKFLILKITELNEAWPSIQLTVEHKNYILLNWPIVVGPGANSIYLQPVTVPADLSGVNGVVLSFLEGAAMQDNEDDRYWYYHYEQMAAIMETPPLAAVKTKLIAFNGLYLTRSTAPDIGNCSRASGFLHYLNDKDKVRLNVHAYRKRIETYAMMKHYNVWAIAEFYSPNFNGAIWGNKNWGWMVVMGVIWGIVVIGRRMGC